jgi:hypothetical protein
MQKSLAEGRYVIGATAVLQTTNLAGAPGHLGVTNAGRTRRAAGFVRGVDADGSI